MKVNFISKMDIFDRDFEEQVLNTEGKVMVEFWGSWCPPCKMMSPLLDKLEKEYQGKVKICKLNIDKNRETPPKFDVIGVPTFILFINGKETKRLVAAQTEEKLREFME